MHRNYVLIVLTMIVLVGVLVNITCKKSEESVTGPTPSNSGIVLGTVKNTAGAGVGDVMVAIGAQSARTNDQGWFSIAEAPPNSRAIITFSKTGYVTTQKIITVAVGQSSFIDATIAAQASPQAVGASAGGTVSSQGSSVTFPPNSFVTSSGTAFSGTANVSANYFDPTSASFRNVFPGTFSGRRASDGVEVPFESYGFMDVNLSSSSGPLQLASGKTATLTIPIPSSLQGSAPATIAMWYYDTTTGYWKEEGVATKTGNTYVGTVTHFTSWNCDRYYDIAYLTGRVVDAQGNPISGAYVTADGVDYSGRSERTTGADGKFTIGVKPNSHVIVKASKGGVTSTPVDVNPTPGVQQTKDIGDIILSPPIAIITLTWGAIPRDLDSHLIIPPQTSGGSTGHVWYNSKGSATYYPFANLDTDDTTGYGPEVVTIFRTFEGTYRYHVHNYSVTRCTGGRDTLYECANSGHLAESGAKVTLIVNNGAIYTFNVPTSNPQNYNVWRVFELQVDAAGKIQIDPLNDFAHNYYIHKEGVPLGKMKSGMRVR
jgi:hypothetical protein